MNSSKWFRNFVRNAARSGGVGEHRIVFLIGPGSATIEMMACREAARAETRSNLTKTAYVFERYATGRGAVWVSADTRLWHGVMALLPEAL